MPSGIPICPRVPSQGDARVHDFTVPVSRLLGHPGEYKDIRVSGSLEGVGTALARVTSQPVSASLRLESVVEGILVTGEVTAQVEQQCSRCLEATDAALRVPVMELHVAPGHEAGPDEDPYRISGTDLNLEPMLRDAIGLALPLKPLCTPGCKGLCPRCGANLNAGTCDCGDDDVDPRWAPLEGLRERLASES